MIYLKNSTFIIPVRIDSSDRAFNFVFTLRHLCENLATNIIILEDDQTPKVAELLKRVDAKETDIQYFFNKNTQDVFHRTRLLNEMLMKVTTMVVVNYDIDIVIETSVYRKAASMIEEGYDLIYPYKQAESVHCVTTRPDMRTIADILPSDYVTHRSDCGHCQFFNTESYKRGGMENENFISWSPEDQERKYRFITKGYRVTWLDNQIYHLEHFRGTNSSATNPHNKQNGDLFLKLSSMNKSQLCEYYQSVEYLKKYR